MRWTRPSGWLTTSRSCPPAGSWPAARRSSSPLRRAAASRTSTSTAPGAAPAGQRILAQARGEVGVLLRNGEQLLVAVVLPALVLIGLTRAHSPDLGAARRVDVITPGVLALALISSAFTGQAIQTGF